MGASEGLGAAYARALAAEGCDVILVARRKKQLEMTASNLLNKYNVCGDTISLDLSLTTAAVQRIAEIA